jgi:hypothetical protein
MNIIVHPVTNDIHGLKPIAILRTTTTLIKASAANARKHLPLTAATSLAWELMVARLFWQLAKCAGMQCHVICTNIPC